MADNKLAGLTEAEKRDTDTLNSGQGSDATADTLHGGQADESLGGGERDDAASAEDEAHDRIAAGADIDPNTPRAGEGDKAAADTIATRKPETDAPTHFEPVQVRPPVPGSDAYDDVPGSTPTVLNATPGADPLSAPSVHTQRTGPQADTVYRAPAMTRGSAINNIEVRWGELVAMLHDFDHDLAGLPDDLQALVGFVKSRSTRA